MSHSGFLKTVPIFEGLTDDEIDRLDSLSNAREIAKGESVVEEGQVGSEFFIVLKGKVAINKNVAGGRRRNLTNLGTREVFGELSLFDMGPRSVNVEATENASLLAFNISAFRKLMNEEIGLANKIQNQIILVLCDRLRNTNNLLNEGVIWGFKMTA